MPDVWSTKQTLFNFELRSRPFIYALLRVERLPDTESEEGDEDKDRNRLSKREIELEDLGLAATGCWFYLEYLWRYFRYNLAKVDASDYKIY